MDILTLNKQTERIGLPLKLIVTAFNLEGYSSTDTSAERCTYSSIRNNSIMKITLVVAVREVDCVLIEFRFSETANIDWIFISELQLCQKGPGLPISCETPTTTLNLSPSMTSNCSQPDSAVDSLATGTTFQDSPL